MAIEVHIFLASCDLPSRDEWQAEIARQGFPVTIDAPFDLHHDTGFRPGSFLGVQTGFEFYLNPAQDILSSYPHISKTVGERDLCATFRFSAGNEMPAALSAAASLAACGYG